MKRRRIEDLAGYNLRIDKAWRQLLSAGVAVTKKQVRAVIEVWRDELFADAMRGPALWPQLGIFEVKDRKERIVGNPAFPGHALKLPRSWRLTFRPSKHRKGNYEP